MHSVRLLLLAACLTLLPGASAVAKPVGSCVPEGFRTLIRVDSTRVFALYPNASSPRRMYLCKPGRPAVALMVDRDNLNYDEGSYVKAVHGRFIEVIETGGEGSFPPPTVELIDTSAYTAAIIGTSDNDVSGATPVVSADGHVAYLRYAYDYTTSPPTLSTSIELPGLGVVDPGPQAHDLTVTGDLARWLDGEDPTPRSAVIPVLPAFTAFDRFRRVKPSFLHKLARRAGRR